MGTPGSPGHGRGSAPTDVEGWSPSGKKARGEGGEAGQARGKRRRVEERGGGEAAGALRPTGPSPEPTPTDWGSGSPLPRQYAPQPVRRVPGTVRGWGAGDVAALLGYMKWAEMTRGGPERRGISPFSDLVGRAGRPREKGPEMEEGAGRGAPRGDPGLSLRTWEKAEGCGCGGSCCRGRAGTRARRRAGQEKDRGAHPCHHLDDGMQSQAHGGYTKGRRAWATGCRQDGPERLAWEVDDRRQAQGKHGAGDGRGDADGQEGAGTPPAQEDGRRGSRGRGDKSRGHGPPEGGSGSAAAETGTVGYGSADRRRCSAGGAGQCEVPDEWSGSEEDGVCAGDRSGRGVQ